MERKKVTKTQGKGQVAVTDLRENAFEELDAAVESEKSIGGGNSAIYRSSKSSSFSISRRSFLQSSTSFAAPSFS